MTLNARCRALDDGEAALCLGGENLLLTVKGGEATVQKTDAAPELTLNTLEAERLLFLPTRFVLPGPKALRNWLPLPWVCPVPDHF